MIIPHILSLLGTACMAWAWVLSIRESRRRRLSAFLARRQLGKTTSTAIAAIKMMKPKNHADILESERLNLSREIVRKESAILQDFLRGDRNQTP